MNMILPLNRKHSSHPNQIYWDLTIEPTVQAEVEAQAWKIEFKGHIGWERGWA